MTKKISRVNSPVRLSEGKVEGVTDLVNLVFEYAVFFRWIFFKNRPRGNLLLIRSFLTVSFFSAVFFYWFHDFTLVLEGIEIDPAIAFGAAIVIGFWYMSHVFHAKSQACAQMYIELIKAGGNGDVSTAKMLSAALAIELLTVDLWAHRQYRGLFAKTLCQAIEHAYTKNSRKLNIEMPPTFEDMIEKVNSGNFQAKESRVLLDNYQDYLMFKSNTYYKAEKAS